MMIRYSMVLRELTPQNKSCPRYDFIFQKKNFKTQSKFHFSSFSRRDTEFWNALE